MGRDFDGHGHWFWAAAELAFGDIELPVAKEDSLSGRLGKQSCGRERKEREEGRGA
jgi:hypothetical protein